MAPGAGRLPGGGAHAAARAGRCAAGGGHAAALGAGADPSGFSGPRSAQEAAATPEPVVQPRATDTGGKPHSTRWRHGHAAKPTTQPLNLRALCRLRPRASAFSAISFLDL